MNRFLPIKKLVTLLFILITGITSWAADPSLSASNVQFPVSGIDGGQFTVTFTGGNGSGGRIVVVKKGSEITGQPVDGTRYNVDANFGTPGTNFTGPGEYVVAHSSSTSPTIIVKGLESGATYYVAVFELNGTYSNASTIDYSTVTPTGKFVTTRVAPTTQATISGFYDITGNSVRLNWVQGNGQGRIVVAKKGNSITELPENYKSYFHNTSFGMGTGANFTVGPDCYVVYKINNSTSAIQITNLEPNTTYTFAIFEYNGSNSPVYLMPTTTMSATTFAGPSRQAAGLNINNQDGNRLGMTWSNGNGSRRLVIAKKGSPVTSVPVNGEEYAPNTQFGLGDEIVAGSGEFVVHTGSYSILTVTNLEKFTEYYFAVFDFDIDNAGNTYYLTSQPPAQGNKSTALAPTGQTTITVSNITGSSAQLTYHAPASGAGSSRMLVIKEGSETTFTPEDLTVYGGGTDTYGAGPLVADNTYILYGKTNGGAPNVKGLQTGHTYYVTLFEMNGNLAPVYKIPGASAQIIVPNEPTAGSTIPNFVSIDGNAIRFDWTKGTGARRLVIARKNSAVSTLPQDGVSYNASSVFGNAGTEIQTGNNEFVVYDGTGSSVTITNLEKATTYHFAVFEYNMDGTGPNYLTTSGKWLAASAATLSAPTIQTTNLDAFNIQGTQADIGFSVGNGSSRIFIMKQGSPVDAEPADFSTYSNNTRTFGNPDAHIGNGNYVIAVGGASFTLKGLLPGTEYYFTAFEFNGNQGTVYLRPGAAMHQFTTTGGITAPTSESTSPVFSQIDGNKMNLSWVSGNGTNRIVVARKGSPVDFIPADGTVYSANAAFGSNSDLGNGQYVLYNGNGNTLSISSLEMSTTYHFAIYEYNGTGSGIKYMSDGLSTSQSSALPPTLKSSDAVNTFTPASISLSWVNGNGNGRIVVAREEGAITSAPENLVKYIASNVFGDGPQLAPGEYVVYAGTGNTVMVTGLTANKNYQFGVFEYNGIDAPVYNISDPLMVSAFTSASLPLTWLYVSAKKINSHVLIEWATSQEHNTKSFTIEKSRNGADYIPLGMLPAAGNSEVTRSYHYADHGMNNGTIFYRIRQEDIDGKMTWSKVVQVESSEKEEIRLLQNPVQDQLGFVVPEHFIGNRYSIVDGAGRFVKTGIITASTNIVTMQKTGAGIHYLVVDDKQTGKRTTKPFIRE